MCVCFLCVFVCVSVFSLIVNPCFGIRFITLSTIKSKVVPAVPARTPCSVLIFKANNFLIHIYIFKAKIVQLFFLFVSSPLTVLMCFFGHYNKPPHPSQKYFHTRCLFLTQAFALTLFNCFILVFFMVFPDFLY